MGGGKDVHQIYHLTVNIRVASGIYHETEEEVGGYEAMRETYIFLWEGCSSQRRNQGGGKSGSTIRKAYTQHFFGSKCPDGRFSVNGWLGGLDDSVRSKMLGIMNCFARWLCNLYCKDETHMVDMSNMQWTAYLRNIPGNELELGY